MVMHTMSTSAYFALNADWTQYEFRRQDQRTASVQSKINDSKILKDGESYSRDLIADDRLLDIEVGASILEYPAKMDTGYDNLNKPVAGNATIDLIDSDHDDLTLLVGKDVCLNFSSMFDTSTAINKGKKVVFELDLGKILANLVWVTPLRIDATAGYSRRLMGVAIGQLLSAVSDRWKLTISWSYYHANQVNDKYDFFSLHTTIDVFGLTSVRTVHLLEIQDESRRGKRGVTDSDSEGWVEQPELDI